MTSTRQNVWGLGDNWAPPILWYARGVKAMKARPLNQPLAWRFFGAMHGIDQSLWRQLGYLSASDQIPAATVVATFWKQCQHGSWYFLPWHRGYLIAFEAAIRDAISQLARSSHRLGVAVLELLQPKPECAAAGLRLRELAGWN